ncbi:hypothetical protein [uncultured Secundilactobacillus sp.]|uniref:hypothetical protein n=1 Tax=uncultured Secundilactobacillus sp. TaxID=2813935 RepID=UPI002590010C|nr:hypothetical protein [uncultured Secundilactobacillus sp.]
MEDEILVETISGEIFAIGEALKRLVIGQIIIFKNEYYVVTALSHSSRERIAKIVTLGQFAGQTAKPVGDNDDAIMLFNKGGADS